MIIECPNCNQKFNLDEKLIPENGRTLKCSACEHIWHYKISLDKTTSDQKITEDVETKFYIKTSKNDKKNDYIKENIKSENISDISKEPILEKKIEEVEVETKVNDINTKKLKMIFAYFIILITSLLGLILLLDTFKYNISNVFPGIIPIFDSFYETLLDLKLFFKDLSN